MQHTQHREFDPTHNDLMLVRGDAMKLVCESRAIRRSAFLPDLANPRQGAHDLTCKIFAKRRYFFVIDGDTLRV
jgi:hypothetical protein